MTRTLVTLTALAFIGCGDTNVDTGYIDDGTTGSYPGLGAQGSDWDKDGRDDASQNIVGPVDEYLGDVFIRGSAFSDPYAWSHGMYLICTNGQVWDSHYWAYTEPTDPADTWYVAMLNLWMERDTWACTFTNGDYEPLIELETWHDLVYTPKSFCFAVVDNNDSDGVPVLAVESNSGTCGVRQEELDRLLRDLAG